MSIPTVAHDPSAREDAGTSPASLGRKRDALARLTTIQTSTIWPKE